MGRTINVSEIRQVHRQADRVLIGVGLLIGSIFLMVGVGFACSTIALTSVAKETGGTVIRNVGNGEGSTAPVVEFSHDGQRHEFQSWLYSSPPQYRVGDKVTVLYDPDDLQRCRIKSFVNLWLFPTIFGGIGLLAVTISGTALVVKWVRRKRQLASAMAEDNTSNFLDPKGNE